MPRQSFCSAASNLPNRAEDPPGPADVPSLQIGGPGHRTGISQSQNQCRAHQRREDRQSNDQNDHPDSQCRIWRDWHAQRSFGPPHPPGHKARYRQHKGRECCDDILGNIQRAEKFALMKRYALRHGPRHKRIVRKIQLREDLAAILVDDQL